VAVRVTVVLLALALTPVVPELLLMAVAMLEAMVEFVAEIAKVVVVALPAPPPLNAVGVEMLPPDFARE